MNYEIYWDIYHLHSANIHLSLHINGQIQKQLDSLYGQKHIGSRIFVAISLQVLYSSLLTVCKPHLPLYIIDPCTIPHIRV